MIDITEDETTCEPLAAEIAKIDGYSNEAMRYSRYLIEWCAEEFGRQYGWKIGKPFSLEQLKRGTAPRRWAERLPQGPVYDHVEYYRQAGKPVGLITHAYLDADRLVSAIRSDGLQVRLLKRSWYFPSATQAALVTPVQGGAE